MHLIKKMAEYENDTEQYLRELFDTFLTENDSALYNRLSASKKQKGKITRSVFNTAVKPLVKVFGSKNADEIYEIFNSYFIYQYPHSTHFNQSFLETNLASIHFYAALIAQFSPLIQ